LEFRKFTLILNYYILFIKISINEFKLLIPLLYPELYQLSDSLNPLNLIIIFKALRDNINLILLLSYLILYNNFSLLSFLNYINLNESFKLKILDKV